MRTSHADIMRRRASLASPAGQRDTIRGERRSVMQPAILDSEKPYVEYHAGRAVRKVSPRTKHALVQGAMLVTLRRCAGSHYRIGTEWDCDLSEQLGNQTLLIPDVSAIAFAGLL